MLEIVIPGVEQYDEINNRFIITKVQSLRLEHSLVSLSKWEAKWRKPYLSKKPKTTEEQIDYIRCMTLTPKCRPECLYRNSAQDFGTGKRLYRCSDDCHNIS